jgi:CubicO group peptidase (beta-lactamase class C family)
MLWFPINSFARLAGCSGRLPLFLLVLAGLAVKSWCATTESEKAAPFDNVVSRYAECGYFQGVVLVAEHGKVIYARGFGDANLESHTPNSPQTRFGIASITKQFTAALVLQEVADGRMRLDATVSEFLPWYRKDTGQRITIDQLLHHTSGLPPDYEMPEFSDTEQARRHYKPREFAEKFCQSDLISEPGTRWEYSNCGYVLLGLILESVTGKPFETLLSERLLIPLGMKDTGLDDNNLALTGGATGYTRHAGPRYTRGPDLDRTHFFSAGAMYSSAEDLLRWNEALSSKAFFSETVRQGMFTPGKGSWADGWFVTEIGQGKPGAGETMAEMRGDLPGNFFTWVLRYPGKEGVIIVLRNGYGSTEHLEENLQAVLFDRTPHFPSRNPKDIIAHSGQTAWRWASFHPGLVCVTLLGVVAGLWIKSVRGKQAAPVITVSTSFGRGKSA